MEFETSHANSPSEGNKSSPKKLLVGIGKLSRTGIRKDSVELRRDVVQCISLRSYHTFSPPAPKHNVKLTKIFISNSNIIPYVPLALTPPLTEVMVGCCQWRHQAPIKCSISTTSTSSRTHCSTTTRNTRRSLRRVVGSSNCSLSENDAVAYFHHRYLGATVLPDMRFSKFVLKVVKNDHLRSWVEVNLEKGMKT